MRHLVEGLAVVHPHDGPDHLRHYDHVSQVRPDGLWLCVWACVLLGCAKLLDEGHWLALEPSVEPVAGLGVSTWLLT